MSSTVRGSVMVDSEVHEGVLQALGRVPSGIYVLTAAHEDRRTGMVCHWVQQACANPPMLTVAIAKGQPILPLISESRKFGLCQIGKDDRLTARKFSNGFDPGEDPFLGMNMLQAATGVPIMASVLSYLECEVSCHMDVEGDHDLFVGRIHAGKFLRGEPVIRVSDS